MKHLLSLFVLLFCISCSEKPEEVYVEEENWSDRTYNSQKIDSMEGGKTYLSVYSQMYSVTQHRKFNLTGLVSMRNASETDSIFLKRADFYNTAGEKVRTYFNYPIYVKPMETLEIVIEQDDIEGGTGSNFIFEWNMPDNCPEPIFEGLMNSMTGTQGVSFTTSGIKL